MPPLGDSNSKLFSLTHLEKILIVEWFTAWPIFWEANLRHLKRFVLTFTFHDSLAVSICIEVYSQKHATPGLLMINKNKKLLGPLLFQLELLKWYRLHFKIMSQVNNNKKKAVTYLYITNMLKEISIVYRLVYSLRLNLPNNLLWSICLFLKTY